MMCNFMFCTANSYDNIVLTDEMENDDHHSLSTTDEANPLIKEEVLTILFLVFIMFFACGIS